MIKWIRNIFSKKQAPALLDDHVQEAEGEQLRAFSLEDEGPYRAISDFLKQEPVDEQKLLDAELKLQAWLFKKYEDGDINYVMSSDEREIIVGDKDCLRITAQRTMRVNRLVLFSRNLADLKVKAFLIGVEQQTHFLDGPLDAMLYRLMTRQPILINSIIQPGMCGSVEIINEGTCSTKVQGALLGELYNEYQQARDTVVRAADNAVQRAVDAVAPIRMNRGDNRGRTETQGQSAPPGLENRIARLTGRRRRSDHNDAGDV